MFYEYSELWHLFINFDKTEIMIFGIRQDQRFTFNLGGHKIDICTDLNILVLFLAEIGTSTKQRNIMLSKLRRKCMYFLNEFIILIFQLIRSCICLTMLFYLFHYMIVKYGALKIAKSLKIYILMISLDRSLTSVKVPLYTVYVTCRIWTTPNTS